MRTTLLALLVTAPLTAQLDDLLVVEKRKDLSARNHLVRHLRGVKVTVSFTDASAKEVVGYLQAVSGKGTNFLLASRTMKDGDYPSVTMKLSNISVANLMAAYEEKTSLRFTYRAGLVLLQPKDEVKEFTYLRIYDVRAAVMPIKNFKPRYKFGLRGSGDEVAVQSDDEEPRPLMFDSDQLVGLIRDNALRESWDTGSTSIEAMRGILLVRQSVRGHRKVENLLRKLGAIPARPVAAAKPTRSTKKALVRNRKVSR